jgi:hypothetical protein
VQINPPKAKLRRAPIPTTPPAVDSAGAATPTHQQGAAQTCGHQHHHSSSATVTPGSAMDLLGSTLLPVGGSMTRCGSVEGTCNMHSLDSRPWHSLYGRAPRFESEGVSVIRLTQRTNRPEPEPGREGRIRNPASRRPLGALGYSLLRLSPPINAFVSNVLTFFSCKIELIPVELSGILIKIRTL